MSCASSLALDARGQLLLGYADGRLRRMGATRIDTLEGELTAADIALSQARKNDHRDDKGRFARVA